MRYREFWELVDEVFGDAYGRTLARDQVLTVLGDRTAAQAIDDGVEPRVVWHALCDALLSAVGEIGWVDDEALMDAVTAVSGSGPAYVFLLAECLAEAGVAAGLDKALANRLARATVAGAGELIHRSSVETSVLRENVTSPGGTTAAALAVLMGPQGLQQLMTKAVAAALSRGRELAR